MKKPQVHHSKRRMDFGRLRKVSGPGMDGALRLKMLFSVFERRLSLSRCGLQNLEEPQLWSQWVQRQSKKGQVG
jgi:hypothetical protein